MLAFNLLPWREDLRRRRCKALKQMGFVIFLCGAIHYLGHYLLMQQITQLASEITALELRLKPPIMTVESDLIASIKRAQQETAMMTHFFASLGRQPLKGTCLTTLSRENDQFIFQGKARSLSDFADYFTHWPTAAFFSEIKMDRLQAGAKELRFQVRASRTQFFYHFNK